MKDREKKRGVGRYYPLFILVCIAFLAATALSYGVPGQSALWAQFFMGFFLCQFAMLKLFHLTGFVEGFQMYDLIAKRFRGYGYLYPFVELYLGLAYLSLFSPFSTYILTIIVMGIGIVSVFLALRQGLNVRCACMGTILNVPLSTVTLVEDSIMGLMAFWMFYRLLSSH